MTPRPQTAAWTVSGILLLVMLSLQLTGCSPNTTGVGYPPDLVAPKITLSGVSAGEVVTGSRVITAAAEDGDSRINSIEIFIDGESLLQGTFDAYAAQLTTALSGGTAAAGQHTLLVHAYDRAGNLAVESVTYHLIP
jgi:hypothetical protein